MENMEIQRTANAVTVVGQEDGATYLVRKDLKSKVCYLFALWPAVNGSGAVSWTGREYTIKKGDDAARATILADLVESYPGVPGMDAVADAVLLAHSTR